MRQYCTEEHLKLHRPEALCFPFKVERKEGVGRYLVATRDIQPMGEMGNQLIASTITLKCIFLRIRLRDSLRRQGRVNTASYGKFCTIDYFCSSYILCRL